MDVAQGTFPEGASPLEKVPMPLRLPEKVKLSLGEEGESAAGWVAGSGLEGGTDEVSLVELMFMISPESF